MISIQAHRGSMLVMVLIITSVGLLFGAGALLLFRYQCQLRIDRQHEIEKVYAVRSALNWIGRCQDEIDENDGVPFGYYTWSGRRLGLLVKPVKSIFPDKDKPNHFTMEGNGLGKFFEIQQSNQYSSQYDYEYGAIGVSNVNALTESSIKGASGDAYFPYGLVFPDVTAPTGATWWVNIGMRGTGGWLKEKYGRRYRFLPRNYVGLSSVEKTKDIMRLCIIRETNHTDRVVGQRHGWPLSPGEYALIFQIDPKNGNSEIEFFERHCTGVNSFVETPHYCASANNATICYMGLQIADRMVSPFYADERYLGGLQTRPYTFCGSISLTDEAYNYFKAGSVYDAVGNVLESPDLRVVFEVEAASSLRPNSSADQRDFLTNFAVTPAWQYDVFLEHPVSVIQLATVAQKIGEFDKDTNTLLTYDTHGTENKGWRKDEREAERKRNGW